MNLKVCNECKEMKGFSEFYANSRAKDGRESTCIPCRRHRERKRRLGSRFPKEKEEEIANLIDESNPRFLIYKRDGFLCYNCGEYLKNIMAGQITLDHIYPKSLGGPNTASNLVTMCKDCNCKKHTKIDVYEIEKCLADVNLRNEKFGINSDLKVKF